MALRFSIPGKTFLAGEYLALHGGPTLVFLSKPCFVLEVKSGQGAVDSIHPESPAGRYIHKYRDDFKNVDLQFQDSYQGRGGFGASTAQFLGCYAFHERAQKFDLKHLLQEYYEAAWNGEGTRPSGADLIGQWHGSMTFFDKKNDLLSVKAWPFVGLDFFLIHTGHKVATHEHLKNLESFDSSLLEQSFAKIRTSFESLMNEDFIDGIRSYAAELVRLGFTCAETQKLLIEIQKIDGVLAAKGCGALGADVVLVVTDKSTGILLERFCKVRGLSIVCSSENISQGLRVQGEL